MLVCASPRSLLESWPVAVWDCAVLRRSSRSSDSVGPPRSRRPISRDRAVEAGFESPFCRLATSPNSHVWEPEFRLYDKPSPAQHPRRRIASRAFASVATRPSRRVQRVRLCVMATLGAPALHQISTRTKSDRCYPNCYRTSWDRP